MKPMNWISATGRMPCAAMPIDTPAIMPSASGVSITRSAPKRACSPAVARKTPPFTPTSSPRMTTLGSCSSSQASAMVTASISVTSGMTVAFPVGVADRVLPLLLQCERQLGIHVVEHVLDRRFRDVEVALHGLVDLRRGLFQQAVLLLVVPGAEGGQVLAQPDHRLEPARRLDLLFLAVPARVIGRGVVAEPVGHGFDQRRAVALAGPC